MTAPGVAGLITGGLAFTALRGAGVGVIGSGGGAGLLGDLMAQLLDNCVIVSTNGQYGRSGIDLIELGLSGGLGVLHETRSWGRAWGSSWPIPKLNSISR
jgi:hypothetical protein